MTITPEQENEMTEYGMGEVKWTGRPTVKALENVLGFPYKCLDHGFVRLIDYMGDDDAIVQAARVSYGKGTKHVSEDKGLIEYLMRHRHTTPFEQCEIKFHCKLPIFVARQWIRHRMANVNEYSARYSILANEFYIPEQQNVAPQSTTNRQGRDATCLNDIEYHDVRSVIDRHGDFSYEYYEYLLNENEKTENHPGIARELARMVLPLNSYTEWYWKVDLHNLFHFLSLRKDKHAQYEIRVYADIIGEIVSKWVPHAWDAWLNCSFEAKHFTRKQWEIIKQVFIQNAASIENTGAAPDSFEEWNKGIGIGKREFDELLEMLK